MDPLILGTEAAEGLKIWGAYYVPFPIPFQVEIGQNLLKYGRGKNAPPGPSGPAGQTGPSMRLSVLA